MLIEDTDLAEYMRSCPDPGKAAPPATESWSEERRLRELERLTFDGMYGITRYARRQATGSKTRIARRKIRQYRAMRRSLWWRMRPRWPQSMRRLRS